ncbi:hypothetical protein C8J57DRAFT_1371035 [Mycena rebaudengoi]|nr:hypothetical protein C8J57DRAFT_1371035 [Mycena rebaudengoi]
MPRHTPSRNPANVAFAQMMNGPDGMGPAERRPQFVTQFAPPRNPYGVWNQSQHAQPFAPLEDTNGPPQWGRPSWANTLPPPPWGSQPFHPDQHNWGSAALEDTNRPGPPLDQPWPNASWGNIFHPNCPPSPAPPYHFAELEDTNRLPRPVDAFAFQATHPGMFQTPWMNGGGNGMPPLVDQGPFGPPMFGNGMGQPMSSTPFAMPSTPFAMHSPFPMDLHPGTMGPMPWPSVPGTPGMKTRPVLFAEKYPYENEHLAPRPSDWRYDYLPPRRFRLISRLRLAGGNKTKTRLEHCHLSPLLLMPNGRMPVMSFDLRAEDPFDPINLELLTTGRPFNQTDLAQLATTRPVRRLRFYHPRLPWYIDVRAAQPNGILVGDVLHQIHEKLHRQIRPEDFNNTVLDATDRELITDAYRSRCDDLVDAMQQGVQRVDFLGGRDGMWLMKTARVNRHA